MRSIFDEALHAMEPSSGGGWRLEPSAAQQFHELITRRFEARDASADALSGELRRLLKLIVVLESKAQSASAADTLIQILRATPAAVDLLTDAQTHRALGRRQSQAKFTNFQGLAERLTAPAYDSPAPRGSLSARELMRPLDSAAVKAKRR